MTTPTTTTTNNTASNTNGITSSSITSSSITSSSINNGTTDIDTADNNTSTDTTVDEVPTADEIARQAAERVAGWWPRDLGRGIAEPDDVAFTRAAVQSVARFHAVHEAKELLAACRPFALWLLSTGQPLDRETAFTDVNLARYEAGPLAQRTTGSRAAHRSHLRRLARAVAEADGVGDPTKGVIAKGEAARVEVALATYKPTELDASRFAAVVDVVRAAARDCHPETVHQAKRLILNSAYLASWVDLQGRELRRDVVFHPDTIEAFAAVMVGSMKPRTAATMASSLRTMSRKLLPGLEPVTRTVHGRVTSAVNPYSPVEVDALFASSDRVSSRGLRRYLLAFLCLGLGTGAHSRELNRVRPSDVVKRDDGRVEVVLTGRKHPGRPAPTRTVVALEPYGAILLDLAAEGVVDKDPWLLGGVGNGARESRSSTLCAETFAGWTPVLNTPRLRANYLLALIEIPLTATELLNAIGSTTLESLDSVVRYAQAIKTDAAQAEVIEAQDVTAEATEAEQAP